MRIVEPICSSHTFEMLLSMKLSCWQQLVHCTQYMKRENIREIQERTLLTLSLKIIKKCFLNLNTHPKGRKMVSDTIYYVLFPQNCISICISLLFNVLNLLIPKKSVKKYRKFIFHNIFIRVFVIATLNFRDITLWSRSNIEISKV